MKQLNGLTAEQIAVNITRAESDGATAEERWLYWKGAKSMLEVFTEDYDFIEEVQNAFMKLYEQFDGLTPTEIPYKIKDEEN